MINQKPYEQVKRTLDVALASFLLIALGPLLALIALLVFVALGRPVIFAQERLGRHGQSFTILKFRTMMPEARKGSVTSESERLVPLGRLLRSMSLDELPQLINVLRGDMSFVGPRPLLIEYLPLYSAEQAKRMDVKPGITGLAQVAGRNSLSWEEKFALDLKYVNTISFRVDFRILMKSLVVVIRRNGVNPRNSGEVQPFMGTKRGKV